jgi:hypothetical protein
MNDTTRDVLRPTPGIAAEQAKDVRARAWQFVFSCHAKKKATRAGGHDAGKEINERSGNPIIPK